MLLISLQISYTEFGETKTASLLPEAADETSVTNDNRKGTAVLVGDEV